MMREYIPPQLCFTANTAGSIVRLNKTGSPTSITLETSTDGENWSTYTFGTYIALSSIGDKVYWRNTSTTTTGFSINDSKRYSFQMSGSLSSSGDITYLVNKNGTLSISGTYCFYRLFDNCTALTSTPSFPATTLTLGCYQQMFQGCTGLTTLPSLPATSLIDYCYYSMFYKCSSIKLSTTQTGAYQTAYRIPTTGTGTGGYYSLEMMFSDTGGTFKSTPSVNTTYYTSNTVV